MLRIRQEQYEAMSRYMLEQFEDRMVAHLRAHFSEQTNDLTDSDLRSFIQEGIEHAERHGVEREDDVRRYLEAMAIHGRDFDTDRRTEWAGTILADQSLTGQQKMDQMTDYEVFVLRGRP